MLRRPRPLATCASVLLATVVSLIAPAPAAPQRADAAGPGGAAVDSPRPLPYPVLESAAFMRAVDAGTRTRTGRPGPRYWQPYAEYRLRAELDTAANVVRGSGTIRYHNRSPRALPVLVLSLYQNLHRPGAERRRVVPVTGGIRLERVAAQGRELQELGPFGGGEAGWFEDGTLGAVRLPTPLAPGDTVELQLQWSCDVPPRGSPRNGTDDEVFLIAYWYPQLAVFDDVDGWALDPYLGNGEFYMGYADYDVELNVPAGFLVGATGTLENAEEVLSPETRRRLERARRTGGVVRVVTAAERGRATLPAESGRHTWRFRAEQLRDFAWGASGRYLWDATRAILRRESGGADTVAIHALYRPDARNWQESAGFLRNAIEFLSGYLWPYPYPVMSMVEGIVAGGMEYPMLTAINGPLDAPALFALTVHETAHMWFPMLAGSNERRFAWQDEGLASFLTDEAIRARNPDRNPARSTQRAYLSTVETGGEVELMRHADLYPDYSSFAAASYTKASMLLHTLEGVLGDEVFRRALREYGTRWSFRHPQPLDFWNTFEDVAGRDLDWFWRPWYFETWTLDQAIGDVRPAGDSLDILIEDRGLAPMPVRLAVTRADGRVERIEVPVDVWLRGARRHTLRIAARLAVTRIEIDPEGIFPDVARANQVWK
jgi:hypothetical protein